ncbi:MAG: hypothetical protein BGO76_00350 [Caedibacter sp. 38-128]|nr:hypothetical protein [Holosporales bacterium]OJX05034.1 MAG: hypothetical protein BGO76_00350 [Caedibacter sp. 38-128]
MFKAYNRRTKRCLLCEEYISLTKDLKAALLLNQCVYWMERTHDYDLFLKEEYEHNPHCNVSYRHGWFYKSYEAFNDECMLESSKSTISRILNTFIEKGWLERRHRKSTTLDQTYEYRVNLTKLQADLLHLGYTLANYKIDPFLSKSAKQQNEKAPILNPEQHLSPVEVESPMFQNETCKLQDETSEKPSFIEVPDFSYKSSMFQNRTSMLQNETSAAHQNMAKNKDFSHRIPMFQNETSMLQNETCKFQNETPYIDTKITNTEITHKTLSPTSLQKPSNSIPGDISKKEREEIGIKMIKMFSRIVSQGQELFPHPERINRLKHVLHSQLQGKLENWEKVCHNITRSKFLMGEAQTSDFKATLDWVMMKDHAIKIFEGNAYGIGDRMNLNTSESDSEEAQEAFMLEFTTTNKHPLWIQAGLILSKKVGFCIFKGWISALDILEIQNDHVTLIAPSKFIRDYVSKNLMNFSIQQALESVLGYELRFVLVNTGSNLERKPDAPQRETQHICIPGKVEEDSSQAPALSKKNAAVSPPNQPQMQNLTASTLGIFTPLRTPFFGTSDPPSKPPNTQELQNEYN